MQPRIPILVAALMLPGCTSTRTNLSFAVEQRILRETTLDDLPEGHAEEDDAVVRVMRGGGACSGALIGPRHVLTAQHCVMRHDKAQELTLNPITPAEVHVELGGGYLPWGRVGVREIHRCEGYTMDVAHDVTVLVLSQPVPSSVPRFELSFEEPSPTGTFALRGFGTSAKARSVPGTNISMSQVNRHERIGFVQFASNEQVDLTTPGLPGDSGGPIVDLASGRITGVVSGAPRPRSYTGEADRFERTVEDLGEGTVAARLSTCREVIEDALAR